MFYADQVAEDIADRLSFYARETSDPSLEPAPLLKRLAAKARPLRRWRRPRKRLDGDEPDASNGSSLQNAGPHTA